MRKSYASFSVAAVCGVAAIMCLTIKVYPLFLMNAFFCAANAALAFKQMSKGE